MVGCSLEILPTAILISSLNGTRLVVTSDRSKIISLACGLSSDGNLVLAVPFPVFARTSSRPELSEEESFIDVTVACDSEMPLVLKAYFYRPDSLAPFTNASAALDVTYSDGSTDANLAFADFGEAPSATWTQGIVAAYPTKVISGAKVHQPGREARGRKNERSSNRKKTTPLLRVRRLCG